MSINTHWPEPQSPPKSARMVYCCFKFSTLLGVHVKLNFVLYHAGETGNVAPGPSPGWFIDDITVGENYNQDGVMLVNNIQPSNSTIKSVNGYGVFFADVFEPAESSLEYTFRTQLMGL